MNCHSIIYRTLAHIAEFHNDSTSQLSKRLIHNNFSIVDGPFLFISNSWNDEGEVSGAGFFLSNSNYVILMVGYIPMHAKTCTDVEMMTINTAIHTILINGFHV